MKNKTVLKIRTLALVVISVWLSQDIFAFPKAQIMQGIKGPWELSVSIGSQEAGLVFPIKVADEDVAQALDKSLPVVGSPIQVKLLQYCPDLEWKTTVVENPNGGPVATIKIAGKDLQQEVVLLSDFPEKHSVTASIGGLAIREIKNAAKAESLLDEMIKKEAVGLLTCWVDPNQPQEFAVGKSGSFQLPQTSFTIDILEYAPHYSVDRETKKVTNYSDNPVNPALKVRMSDGQNSYEQWLWSNFSTSPHGMSKLPVKVRFHDFDLGPSDNRFFLVTDGDSNEVMLYCKDDDKVHYEPMQKNKPYPFEKDKEYTFSLESILSKGIASKTSANKANELAHPALLLSVESGDDKQETVVELNKPGHVKTEYGMVVLLYRQEAKTKEHGDK